MVGYYLSEGWYSVLVVVYTVLGISICTSVLHVVLVVYLPGVLGCSTFG